MSYVSVLGKRPNRPFMGASSWGPVKRVRLPPRTLAVYKMRGQVGAVAYGNKYQTRFRRTGFRGYMRTSGAYGRFNPGGPERKWLDRNGDNINGVSVTGSVGSSLNLIPQGASQSQRVGAKTTLTDVMIRGSASLAPGSTIASTTDRLRIILYLDTQANGTVAGVTDILQTGDIDSFNNLYNVNRFRILSDQYLDLVAEAGANDGAADQFGNITQTWQIYKKVRIPLEFNGATGAITEIRSNNVGIMFITQQNGLTNVEWSTRVRFMDV